jgi:hypothetical protein
LFLRHQLNIALRRASLKVMHAANVSPTNDLNRQMELPDQPDIANFDCFLATTLTCSPF